VTMSFGSFDPSTEPVLTLYHTAVSDLHLTGGAPVPTGAWGQIDVYPGGVMVGNVDRGVTFRVI
jgi:hypothetical protein